MGAALVMQEKLKKNCSLQDMSLVLCCIFEYAENFEFLILTWKYIQNLLFLRYLFFFPVLSKKKKKEKNMKYIHD